MEFGQISKHNIRIRHTVNGGIIAKVGCAELSFSNPKDMMDLMKQYYEDPEGMEKKYNASIGTTDAEAEAPTPRHHEDQEEDTMEDRPQPNRAVLTRGLNEERSG